MHGPMNVKFVHFTLLRKIINLKMAHNQSRNMPFNETM